jgi:predicted ATPase with chaperone activity
VLNDLAVAVNYNSLGQNLQEGEAAKAHRAYNPLEEGQSPMRAAMSQLNLSARAYHRILKLARTLRKTRRAGDCGSGGV